MGSQFNSFTDMTSSDVNFQRVETRFDKSRTRGLKEATSGERDLI
jgi:hypothetical protein